MTTVQSYRSGSFLVAAEQLGIEVVQAVHLPRKLAEFWELTLGVDFNDVQTAVSTIVEFAQERPLAGILAIDDSGVLLAAEASAALNLPHNDPKAAWAARDKYKMRQLLAAGGAPVPLFLLLDFEMGLDEVEVNVSTHIGYPCVLKPRQLSGSRGVMRCNNEAELAAGVARLRQIDTEANSFLVEQFIPGIEVALEGMLENGRLRVLALFDKPDPLDGPFFEETIYVTPSRLSESVQEAIGEATANAAAALGLRTGPIHAELRINENGPWIVEVAGRSIGGLCSQTLRFDDNGSLEELILRQLCGLPMPPMARTGKAGGVMMIPIPQAGLLRGYDGVEAATAVSGVEEVKITAPLNNRLLQLPEGESYLGFIFARAETPAAVEAALRQAHNHLQFQIDVEIPLKLSPSSILLQRGRAGVREK